MCAKGLSIVDYPVNLTCWLVCTESCLMDLPSPAASHKVNHCAFIVFDRKSTIQQRISVRPTIKAVIKHDIVFKYNAL